MVMSKTCGLHAPLIVAVHGRRPRGSPVTGRPFLLYYGLYFALPEAVMTVPPSCFIPRPGVDSCVLHLKAHEKPPVECSEKVMFALIRAAFNQRRKTLANAVSHGYSLEGRQFTREEVTAALEEAGFPPAVRGEALSLEQFAALSLIMGQNTDHNTDEKDTL